MHASLAAKATGARPALTTRRQLVGRLGGVALAVAGVVIAGRSLPVSAAARDHHHHEHHHHHHHHDHHHPPGSA